MSQAGIFIYQIQSTTRHAGTTHLRQRDEQVQQKEGVNHRRPDFYDSQEKKKEKEEEVQFPEKREQQDKQRSPLERGRKPVKYLSRKKEKKKKEKKRTE
ncbi:hypothetical protein CEXT_766741 [Caerostris extrusa]|uniref:Uncharacterized protein n=1 Tax=Caerostris extrusa TaxID=172846 RepID=A0AAV4UHX2_CAEEX|nr:hypothetical protein CEXT_766741 [Caerostris extrusa]